MEDMLSPLYPVLDASFLPVQRSARESFLQALAEELLAAGVTLLQYRNKSRIEDEVVSDSAILRSAIPPGDCFLILNDYPLLATRVSFDGVHVGQEDTSVPDARLILGPDRIVGVSTHNPKQIASAQLTSADYVAVGPVFATSSKQNPDPVIGLDGVRRARQLTTKPLVAIGGITVDNCAAVREAGADSVAVISALFAKQPLRSAGKIASDFFSELR